MERTHSKVGTMRAGLAAVKQGATRAGLTEGETETQSWLWTMVVAMAAATAGETHSLT